MSGPGFPLLQLIIPLIAAPLLPGIVNRMKAVAAGRRGQPLLQGYHDLAKLLAKGAIYSRTTSWIFRAGPTIGCAAAMTALAILPWAGVPALIAFDGDVVLFAALFGLARFITILAALDTGSAFEGMGASREAWFSALTEPALLLALAATARLSGSLSLSGMLIGGGVSGGGGAALLLAAGAAVVVFLTENARIPIDDPTTHLELTMIHEVMVLDHGGVDFAFIQYGAMVKLWALGALAASLLVPRFNMPWLDMAVGLAAMLCVAVGTGFVESVMARLPLARVPQLLVAGIAMAALSLALTLVR